MRQLAAFHGSRLALGTAAAGLMSLIALTSTCAADTNGTAGRDGSREREDPAAVVTELPADEHLTGETTDASLLSGPGPSAGSGASDAQFSSTAARGSSPPVANRNDAASSPGEAPSPAGGPGRRSPNGGGDDGPSTPARRTSPASTSTSSSAPPPPSPPPPAPSSSVPAEPRSSRATTATTREPAPAADGAPAAAVVAPSLAPAGAAAPASQAPATAQRSAGIYLVRDDGARQRLEPAVVSQVVEEGGFFAPRRQTGVIRGLRAALRATDHFQKKGSSTSTAEDRIRTW